jgi:hypothetical protein
MTRTATAVAEALGQAHAALTADLRQLEQAVQPAAGASVEEVRDRLAATRTHIAEHFRFEEENGYMDAVRKREPRLERAIQLLAAEHRQLARSLDALIGAVGSAAGLGNPLREEVREWIDDVRQHEIRENDLVQDAFNQEVGAED